MSFLKPQDLPYIEVDKYLTKAYNCWARSDVSDSPARAVQGRAVTSSAFLQAMLPQVVSQAASSGALQLSLGSTRPPNSAIAASISAKSSGNAGVCYTPGTGAVLSQPQQHGLLLEVAGGQVSRSQQWQS